MRSHALDHYEPAQQARLLSHRLRVGQLSRARLEAAAGLGNSLAKTLCGERPPGGLAYGYALLWDVERRHFFSDCLERIRERYPNFRFHTMSTPASWVDLRNALNQLEKEIHDELLDYMWTNFSPEGEAHLDKIGSLLNRLQCFREKGKRLSNNQHAGAVFRFLRDALEAEVGNEYAWQRQRLAEYLLFGIERELGTTPEDRSIRREGVSQNRRRCRITAARKLQW